LGGDVAHRLPRISLRSTPDKRPGIGIETASFIRDRPDHARVLDGALDLESIPHDAAQPHEALDTRIVEAGDGGRIEALERRAVGLPLAEDRHPTEPGLGTLEHQEFEEQAIVMYGHAPLAVVVVAHQGIALGPAASCDSHSL